MKNETELKIIRENFIALYRQERVAYLAFQAACDAQVLANNLVIETKLAFLSSNENLRDLRDAFRI